MNFYEPNSSLGPCGVTKNILSNSFLEMKKSKCVCPSGKEQSLSDKDQAESALHFLEPA